MAAPVKITSSGSRYCDKCRRTISEKMFYTYKNGDKCELCKNCLTMHVNNFDPSTYLWILEKFDVPYIEGEWIVLRDRAYQKDPYKMNGLSVIGKYISKMKLRQWNMYGWADTEKLKAEAEAVKEETMRLREGAYNEEMEKAKAKFEAGEITEEEYKIYTSLETPAQKKEYISEFTGDPEKDFGMAAPHRATPSTSQPGFYPVNNHPFEEVELPSVSDELTKEDKIYLATKWGRLYSADQWVWLEKKYEDFMNSFDIQGAARIDTLIFICKTSLKMNDALDSGDIDSYQKLSKVYDAQMKAAKFTEAQRKEEKAGEFDAVGCIVAFAEKEAGAIERYHITSPLDKADEAIEHLKTYTKDLILSDIGLQQRFETFLTAMENARMAKEARELAKEKGVEFIEVTDQDMADFNDAIYEQKEQDLELLRGALDES